MKNRVIVGSIFASILILSFSAGFLLSNQITTKRKHDYILQEGKLAMQIHTLLATDGMRLDKEMEVISTQGEPILLSSLIKEETFVIYFTKLDCMACIDRELQVLNKYFDVENLRSRILLIGNFNNIREQKLLERNMRIRTLQAKDSSFFSSFNNKKSIIYCLVDTNMTIHSCMDLGTIESNINVSSIYYKTMSDRFRNNKERK